MENGSDPQQKKITLSDEIEARIEQIIGKYPQRKSAIMPALYLAQEHYGWITDEAVEWVAERVGVSEAHVRGVATFYTMYYKKPVGKYHIQVCRTLSCMLCGARELAGHVQQRLGLESNEVSADGMWSWEDVECLGSCGTAPMVQINGRFFENLTPEALDGLMDRIEKEQPELRYSTLRQELGEGMPDLPISQVWKPEQNE